MPTPQLERGYARIANELIEALSRINLSAYEWRVFFCVLRKTYGWNKGSDFVSISQLALGTGLKKSHVSRAKKALLTKNILHIDRGKLGINKDWRAWGIPSTGDIPYSGNETQLLAQKQRNVTYLGDTPSTGSALKRENTPYPGNKTQLSSQKQGNVTSTGDIPYSGNSVTYSGNKVSPVEGNTKDIKDTYTKDRHYNGELLTYWNNQPNLPVVRKMTDSRRKKLIARMREADFADHWQEIVDRIAASSFCTGGGTTGWKASFDWLIANDTNYAKVLEGRYDDAEPQHVPLERLADGRTPREALLQQYGGNHDETH